MALGIVSDVGIGVVLVDPEQAPSTQVPLDPPDRALEHGADLARLQVPESLPAQLYIAHNFTFFFTVTWFFPYLKEEYSLSAEQTALYAAAPLLCGVLGNWIAGATVDMLYRRGRWALSRRLPAILGFVLGAAGMTLCIQMSTPGAAVAAMCVAIFGADMILSPSWSTCLDIGGRNAGSVSGTMNMAGNLGAFVTSLAFPYLHGWTGTHEPFFYLAGALNLVAIVMWTRIRPDRPLEQER